jgi:plastocyanin
MTHLSATMFRGIAILAVAAIAVGPTGVWAEGGRGGNGGEVELRHGADDALIRQADDNSDVPVVDVGDDQGDRAAEVGDDRGADDGAAAAPAAGTPPPTAPAAPAGQANSVVALSVVEGGSAQDWTYAPAQLTTTVGTTLTWTNAGAEDHTVTSDDRTSFDSRNISPHATFSFAPTTAGTFAYHCAYHPWMKGTITVTQ